MSTLRKATKEFESYLDTLPTIYVIGHWSNYGILPFKFEKFKYNKSSKAPVPLIWYLIDEEYHLINIEWITANKVIGWTFDKEFAESIIAKFNSDIYSTISPDEFQNTLSRIYEYNYGNNQNKIIKQYKTAKSYISEVLRQLGYSDGVTIFKEMEQQLSKMQTITIEQVLKDCEYSKVYIRTRNWDKYGVQVADESGYCVKDKNGIWMMEDPNIVIDLKSTICGFKWRGEHDIECPVLCINLPTHWVEFDPETRRVKDMCQIHDGYQAYKTRLEKARDDCN